MRWDTRRGSASNTLAMQAFCSVVSREGSCLGRSTLSFPMFAWPGWVGPETTFTCRYAPSALLVFACVSAEILGLNGRFAQFTAANGLDTAALRAAGRGDRAGHRPSGAVGRVEHEVRPIDRHVERADVERDALLDDRYPAHPRIACDRQLRGVRVDLDPCARMTTLAEIERPGDRRHDDAQPEGRARVGTRQVHLVRRPARLGQVERVCARARTDRRRADLRRLRAGPSRRLRFGAAARRSSGPPTAPAASAP